MCGRGKGEGAKMRVSGGGGEERRESGVEKMKRNSEVRESFEGYK